MEELDRLEESGATVGSDAQMTLFFASVAVTLVGALCTTEPRSDLIGEAFVSALAVCIGGFIICGYRWHGSGGKFKKVIGRIRERQVGPVGSEERELNPDELAVMPSHSKEHEG